MKQNNVQEGRWTLALGFQIGIGMSGPSPEQMALGPVIGINQIGIERVPEGQAVQLGATVVDAAELKAKKPSGKKRKAAAKA